MMQQKNLNEVKSVWLEVTQINYQQEAGIGFTFHFYCLLVAGFILLCRRWNLYQ